MKRMTLSNILAAAALATVASLSTSQTAHAVPINGFYIEDSRCEVLPNKFLTHELGDVSVFPANEAIAVTVTKTLQLACVADDLIPNDWNVRIINLSGQAWNNMYFVADLGMTVGNADGNVLDVINAPGVIADAFRIDGTVTVGVNNNLLSESINNNEIFEPGEVWEFLVTNFADPFGFTPPPMFQSPGVFGGSSPANAAFTSASILATPVPEPAAIGILGVALVAMLMHRPNRVRS